MQIISNCTHNEVKRAAKALKDGHLVAFPTETVYGLGADASNAKAVARIYSTKGRPTDHPLIVHISSINEMSKWAIDIPEYAMKLARDFWPGPMTLILKRSNTAKDFITGSQSSVGIRVPSHPLALSLIIELEKLGGYGVAAPSANRFGAVSPTSSEAVYEELGAYLAEDDLILDGGQSNVGIESTIIDCTGFAPTILRPGAIFFEMIANTTGIVTEDGSSNNVTRTSGLFEKHYSPRARVLLGYTAQPGEGFIAMANTKTPIGSIRLASPETIFEYAHTFYSSLRLADKKGLATVVVNCPDGDGLLVAIRDRLNKAAQG
jgi:L-threonylcarbamoyladenylate synthase